MYFFIIININIIIIIIIMLSPVLAPLTLSRTDGRG